MIDEDESWFNRFAQPQIHAWMTADAPLRLVQRTPPPKPKDKTVSCFGGLRQATGDLYLDFADGYPNSEQQWRFICRLLKEAKRRGKKVLVVIWDNAPWHPSKRIKCWIRAYNQWAKHRGSVRLLVHWLPRKSPWLNPIEPHWGHAKKQVCEPSGDLAMPELKRRIGTYFQARPLRLHANP